MRAALLPLAFALIVSGCVDPSEESSGTNLPDCTVPAFAANPSQGLPANNDRWSSSLLLVKTPGPVKLLDVTIPKDGKWEQKVLSSGNQTFLQFNVKAPLTFGPGRAAGIDLPQQHPFPPMGPRVFMVNFTIDPAAAKCKMKESASQPWTLGFPSGRTIAAGKGVHLRHATFHMDGRLVETNIAELEQNSAWPRDAAYKYTGPSYSEVYVYGSDPSEKPAVWSAPQDPTGARLYDYKTLPKTFNEAVKTHASLQPKAFVSPAAEAIKSAAGTETVTYFVVEAVVDYPCPPQQPTKCTIQGQ